MFRPGGPQKWFIMNKSPDVAVSGEKCAAPCRLQSQTFASLSWTLPVKLPRPPDTWGITSHYISACYHRKLLCSCHSLPFQKNVTFHAHSEKHNKMLHWNQWLYSMSYNLAARLTNGIRQFTCFDSNQSYLTISYINYSEMSGWLRG